MDLEAKWRSGLVRMYERLTRDDSVQPADLIFVMAGRMERKPYGIELYRAGVAPHLLLSVGRFEVSRMRELALEKIDELAALRDRTDPDERHFFVTIDVTGIRIEKVRLPRWSTYGEALGFRQFLEKAPAQRVIVVSTDIHLRRVALTFGHVFRNHPVEFLYCPVPARLSGIQKNAWWTRPDDRRFVVKEMLKLAGYRAILSAPAWAIPRLMRLKKE